MPVLRRCTILVKGLGNFTSYLSAWTGDNGDVHCRGRGQHSKMLVSIKKNHSVTCTCRYYTAKHEPDSSESAAITRWNVRLGRTREWVDDNDPSLGLQVRIDDRTLVPPDVLVVQAPGVGPDGFADTADDVQRTQFVRFYVMPAQLAYMNVIIRKWR